MIISLPVGSSNSAILRHLGVLRISKTQLTLAPVKVQAHKITTVEL